MATTSKRGRDGSSFSIPKSEDYMMGPSDSPSSKKSKDGVFIIEGKGEFVGENTLTGFSYVFLLNKIWKIGHGFLLLEEEAGPPLDFQVESKVEKAEILRETSRGKENLTSIAPIGIPTSRSKDLNEGKGSIAPIGIPTSLSKALNKGKGRIFFDFEGQRSSAAIRRGEIWAMYDDYGMPRSYVEISAGNDAPWENSDGMIHGILLRSHPKSSKQWYNDSGNLYTCGMFFPVCHLSFPMDLALFSHKISMWRVDETYFIYPRKGEVWAITTGISTTPFQIDSPTIQKYQLVETLEDYNLKRGIEAVYLVRVKGEYRNLFQRHLFEGVELTCHIPLCDLKRFSHQVPSYSTEEEDGFLSGCLELDPSSLPLYIDDFEVVVDPEINDNFLCLGFLDIMIGRRHDEFEGPTLWAAYDDQNRLPVNYIVTNPMVEELIYILEPCPISEFQKQWYRAGLPIACGFFRIKEAKPKCQSHIMVSHLVQIWPKQILLCYHIYPLIGQVWGIYKDWDMRGDIDLRRMGKLRYDIVEVTGEYSEKCGVKVVYLVRVDGFKNLFSRKSENGEEVSFVVCGDKLYRFSHQIPAYRFDVKQSDGILNGSLVLDPSLVPEKGGDCFTFGDSSLLDKSVCQSSRFAIQHFVEKEKNKTSLDYREKTCWQSENCSINLNENVLEGQAVNPSDKKGEMTPTLEEILNVEAVGVLDERTLINTEAVRIVEKNHQQSEICSINLKEVFEEKMAVLIDNRGATALNVEASGIIDDIMLRNQGHEIKGVEAEAAGVVGDIATSENDSIYGQPIIKLYGFDDPESERTFKVGEIWALYDELDGLPRSYACINQFIRSEGNAEVTILEPHPMADEEMRWVEENLPVACGNFRASKSTSTIEMSFFSHRVICDEGRAGRFFYRIFPRKGEVWAMYKNWDVTWNYSDLEKSLQYKLVEVVSDFTEEKGVTVAALTRAEGHEAVFRRQLNEGFGLFRTFKRKDLLRFSHCIPSLKMRGEGKDEISEGLLKIKFTHQGI